MEFLYLYNVRETNQSLKKSLIMKNQLSKYNIKWLVLEAEKGVATNRDIQILNRKVSGSFKLIRDKIVRVVRDENVAQSTINELKNINLNKKYKVTIITDKQFGESKINMKENTINFEYTTKQIENTIIIG